MQKPLTVIHQKNSTTSVVQHIKGYQDKSTRARFRGGIKCRTNRESASSNLSISRRRCRQLGSNHSLMQNKVRIYIFESEHDHE